MDHWGESMITIPETAYVHRIMAIDNGSDTMGVSMLDLDLQAELLQVIHSETCTASRSAVRYEGMGELLGLIYARYEVLSGFIAQLLEEFDPDVIVVEAPFVHLNVSTYNKLEGSISVIRRAAWEYNCLIEVIRMAPMSAKKGVRASSYKGKDPIRDAVLALQGIRYSSGINPRLLDEHCIDAIAVGYTHAQEVLKIVHRR